VPLSRPVTSLPSSRAPKSPTLDFDALLPPQTRHLLTWNRPCLPGPSSSLKHTQAGLRDGNSPLSRANSPKAPTTPRSQVTRTRPEHPANRWNPAPRLLARQAEPGDAPQKLTPDQSPTSTPTKKRKTSASQRSPSVTRPGPRDRAASRRRPSSHAP
jgi:hypothetical protein